MSEHLQGAKHCSAPDITTVATREGPALVELSLVGRTDVQQMPKCRERVGREQGGKWVGDSGPRQADSTAARAEPSVGEPEAAQRVTLSHLMWHAESHVTENAFFSQRKMFAVTRFRD